MTDEERKISRYETLRKYYLKNKDKIKEYQRNYHREYSRAHRNQSSKTRTTKPKSREVSRPSSYSKEYQIKRLKEYNKTPMGRACYLVNRYKSSDREHNRGECDFDARWVVENIFSKPCVHCGETDWTKLGCNRLDNSKPHTMDNVEPCCGKCNRKIR